MISQFWLISAVIGNTLEKGLKISEIIYRENILFETFYDSYELISENECINANIAQKNYTMFKIIQKHYSTKKFEMQRKIIIPFICLLGDFYISILV